MGAQLFKPNSGVQKGVTLEALNESGEVASYINGGVLHKRAYLLFLKSDTQKGKGGRDIRV